MGFDNWRFTGECRLMLLHASTWPCLPFPVPVVRTVSYMTFQLALIAFHQGLINPLEGITWDRAIASPMKEGEYRKTCRTCYALHTATSKDLYDFQVAGGTMPCMSTSIDVHPKNAAN